MKKLKDKWCVVSKNKHPWLRIQSSSQACRDAGDCLTVGFHFFYLFHPKQVLLKISSDLYELWQCRCWSRQKCLEPFSPSAPSVGKWRLYSPEIVQPPGTIYYIRMCEIERPIAGGSLVLNSLVDPPGLSNIRILKTNNVVFILIRALPIVSQPPCFSPFC